MCVSCLTRRRDSRSPGDRRARRPAAPAHDFPFWIQPLAALSTCCRAPLTDGGARPLRHVHKLNSSDLIRRFVKPPNRAGFRVRARVRGDQPRTAGRAGARATPHARPPRARRRSPAACRGTMPCPRLKMCPGPGPRRERCAAASRATVAASVVSTSGSRLPCSATCAPTCARAAPMSTVQSRPTPCAPIAAISGSSAPRALGEDDRRHGCAVAPARKRREHGAHRREREAPVRVGAEQPAPGVEDHHRVRARGDLLVQVRGDGARVDVDELRQQVRPRVRHPPHAWRNRRCRRLRSCSTRA